MRRTTSSTQEPRTRSPLSSSARTHWSSWWWEAPRFDSSRRWLILPSRSSNPRILRSDRPLLVDLRHGASCRRCFDESALHAVHTFRTEIGAKTVGFDALSPGATGYRPRRGDIRISASLYLEAASAADVRPAALDPGTPPAGAAAQGPLEGSQELQLSVVLPPSKSDQLQGLLSQLYDPHSALFHKWLSPGQFVQEFGPSTSEIDTVTSWLHGVGLVHTAVSDFSIEVTASAAEIASALGTSFERYQTSSGHKGYLSQQVPSVPSSLAGGRYPRFWVSTP